LNRFKKSKSKYGFGGTKKNEIFVDFPLEGLDMTPYVLSESQKKSINLNYDCYAVSNHYGGVGGGHYTAFAKN
jgi:ubiquitin carboxyl-terminal hydrolase 4/11/15